MDYVPMPECAYKRFSEGYAKSIVREDWVEPIERWTAKLAEIDSRFEYQDIKIKWGGARVYVSAGDYPWSDTLTDEEYGDLHTAYHKRDDALREMAEDMEAELTEILSRA